VHEEMDHAVIAAYAVGDPEGRWLELEVPPFCPLDAADEAKLERFKDGVIDRLFVLNAKRVEEERMKGLGDAGKGKTAAWGSKWADENARDEEAAWAAGDWGTGGG
jgi:hypothetical protein